MNSKIMRISLLVSVMLVFLVIGASLATAGEDVDCETILGLLYENASIDEVHYRDDISPFFWGEESFYFGENGDEVVVKVYDIEEGKRIGTVDGEVVIVAVGTDVEVDGFYWVEEYEDETVVVDLVRLVELTK